MMISVFDLFKVGVGPSSSHTVGPMVAARRFLEHLKKKQYFDACHRVTTQLHGSLAHTGKGHATSSAILMGLQGEQPHLIDAMAIPHMIKSIIRNRSIKLLNQHPIHFIRKRDVIYDYQTLLPQHPNGLTFRAFDQHGVVLIQRQYFSIGGGFVLSEDEIHPSNEKAHLLTQSPQPMFPFQSADELLNHCQTNQLSIAQLVLQNELAFRSKEDINNGIQRLWHVMEQSIQLGCETLGELPGGLAVPRRAPKLYQRLTTPNGRSQPGLTRTNELHIMDWVNLYALAVNEQNAGGGQVVTAPTNGAAGVIPAVLAYYLNFEYSSLQTDKNTEQNSFKREQAIVDFMLTATAIGSLFKKNASISAAEVGCQGEVGVACSMAAAALTAVLGGSNQQIENAAEIGMEHNLGLTCDPIKGLVQIPCIERNTMGAIQAINAARLALLGDGSHKVSLDQVIETMRQTGIDMQAKYKETSKGGLAVNFVDC